ncbi:MAG: DUF1289 domain-containing protein [Burkholderiaceae bacterium]
MQDAPVPSPCTSVCSLSPETGYCLGCLRTIDEIAHWGQMTNAEKRAVVSQLDTRREHQPATKGPK